MEWKTEAGLEALEVHLRQQLKDLHREKLRRTQRKAEKQRRETLGYSLSFQAQRKEEGKQQEEVVAEISFQLGGVAVGRKCYTAENQVNHNVVELDWDLNEVEKSTLFHLLGNLSLDDIQPDQVQYTPVKEWNYGPDMDYIFAPGATSITLYANSNIRTSIGELPACGIAVHQHGTNDYALFPFDVKDGTVHVTTVYYVGEPFTPLGEIDTLAFAKSKLLNDRKTILCHEDFPTVEACEALVKEALSYAK